MIFDWLKLPDKYFSGRANKVKPTLAATLAAEDMQADAACIGRRFSVGSRPVIRWIKGDGLDDMVTRAAIGQATRLFGSEVDYCICTQGIEADRVRRILEWASQPVEWWPVSEEDNPQLAQLLIEAGCEPTNFGYWWKWFPERVRPDAPEWILDGDMVITGIPDWYRQWLEGLDFVRLSQDGGGHDLIYGRYARLIDKDLRFYSGLASLSPKCKFMPKLMEVVVEQPLAAGHNGKNDMDEQGIIAATFQKLNAKPIPLYEFPFCIAFQDYINYGLKGEQGNVWGYHFGNAFVMENPHFERLTTEEVIFSKPEPSLIEKFQWLGNQGQWGIPGWSMNEHCTEIILNHAALFAGKEVLEMGTSRGRLSAMLATLGCNVTTIDHIDRNARKNLQNLTVEVIIDDAIHFLETNNQNFDLIICDLHGNSATEWKQFSKPLMRCVHSGSTLIISNALLGKIPGWHQETGVQWFLKQIPKTWQVQVFSQSLPGVVVVARKSKTSKTFDKKSFIERFSIIPFFKLQAYKIKGIRKTWLWANLFAQSRIISQSSLFDKKYYVQNNPDVKSSGMSATKHYLLYGGFEGRKPSEKFDSQFYLEHNSDVANSGMNPLVHFLKYGKFEGRQVFPEHAKPKPLINCYSNPLKEYFYNNRKNIIHKWLHYFEIYHKHFNRFANTECVILEIGVGQGGSLQMWKNYFGGRAKIYGVDIDPNCKDFEEENIEIFIGSQADRNFLQNLKQILPKIDILIDDGGHTMDQQITCFEELFDHIKEDGIYLCEDTLTSYWEEFGGGLKKQGSFIEFTKNLIDHLHGWHIRNNSLEPQKHACNIGSLHYYDSIFIIEKEKRCMPHHERRGENIHEVFIYNDQFEMNILLLKLKILGVELPDNYELTALKNNSGLIQYICGEKYEGTIWPSEGETMIGYKRLTNLEFCIIDTINNQIEGDLIETGVWRGGSCIFMRALLKDLGVLDKKVWLADSFSGLPEPNVIVYPQDKDLNLHLFNELAISLEEVKNNFAKYNLLDDQVKFLKGWFKDTMPVAPIEKLSVLRLDGDLYESTIDVLLYLYPKLSIGGYCIIDDWGAIDACRNAVEDYRKVFGCNEPIQTIDWTGVYWKKEQEVTPKPKEYFIKMIQTK
jgi:spermidine synthase